MTFNICYVCTGNICRSPFAEVVTRSLLKQEDLCEIDVWSCGTRDLEQYPRDSIMITIAQEMGYEMRGESCFMSRESLNRADMIVAFTSKHRDEICKLLDQTHCDRVILFNEIAFGKSADVEDPCFQSWKIYREIATHIEEGCRNIVKKLKAKENNLYQCKLASDTNYLRTKD